jgi:hypothetical protein
VPHLLFNSFSDRNWEHKRDLQVIDRIKVGTHGKVERALPVQIICSLDCMPGSSGAGPELFSREIIYIKIARLFDVYVFSPSQYQGVLYALILERIKGDIETFRRIGITQILDNYGMTEGWPT